MSRSRRALADVVRRRLDLLAEIGCSDSGLPLEKREAANVLARELRREVPLNDEPEEVTRNSASDAVADNCCSVIVAAFLARLKKEECARALQEPIT